MFRKSLFSRSWIKLSLAGLVISVCLMSAPFPVWAGSGVLAGWNGFGMYAPFYATSGNAANLGTAALTAVVSGGPNPPFATSTGAPPGESGVYIAQGWANGSGSKYWKVHFSSTGFQNLTVSSQQMSTDLTFYGWDGPRDFKLQYSTNDSTWTDIGSALTLSGSWSAGGRLTNLALPAGLNNQANVYLRWIMTSNNAVGSDGMDGNAQSLIGGIYIRGDEIPSAPTDIQLSGTNLFTTDPPGTVVGNFSVSDTNVYDTWTYTLVPGSGSTNNGSFIISGNQLTNNTSLSAGTYSIRVNVFDGTYNLAKVFSITVTYDDSYSPMTGGDTQYDDYITNVTFAGINNNSGKTSPGYADYTGGTAASVTQGSGYTLSTTVHLGCPNPPVESYCKDSDNVSLTYFPQYIKVWFDWNQDHDFDDAGEGIDINTNRAVSGTDSITVNVPATAVLGPTRMRVVNNADNNYDHNPPEPPNHGSTAFYGEAEDYTVNVTPALTNSIAPTSVQNINTSTNGSTLTVTETPAADSRQWKYGTVSGGPYSTNISGATGTSYTPNFATAGTYYIVCASTKSSYTATSNEVRVNVGIPPSITSADHTTFTAGNAGSFMVTTTPGSPAATTLSKTGALPTGVTFTDNGNGTASLAGTPAAGTGGTYPLTITASNGVSTNATQSFTLTVNQAPAITSTNSTTFATGAAGTFTVTTSGFPTGASMVLSKTGALPTGVTFTDHGNGTASLAGTPAAGTGGTYPLTITASNGVSPNATQSFTLTVNQAPAITSANNTTFSTGAAGSFTVTTSGFPTGASMLISRTGALPSGVSFTDNANGTASLAGTPAAGTGGPYPLTITASNGVSPNATQSFTLMVNQAPAITSANSTTFSTGAAGSFTVATSGFPTGASMVLSRTGTLPSGVSFTDDGNGTASLAGTPAAGTGGTYPLTITASNGVGTNATQSFTLTVNQAPAITSANSTTFSTGTAGSFTVTTSGFPAGASMVLSRTGALPSGVTFTDNGDGTASLAGTLGTATSGTYPLTITADNGVGSPATQSFTLTVQDATSPTVDTFMATSPTASLDISITAFVASDNVSVTGYMITTGSTAPAAADPGWTPGAPTSYTVALAGSYTLYPWARDAAGNVSPVFGSPASVLVDLTPPDTSITGNPPDPNSSSNAAFSFSGNDGSGSGIASFQCDLDGTGFAPCTSPQTYTGQSDGSHTFQVRAVDGAGNVDASPASYTWTIDTTPPDTSITAQPSDPSNSAGAVFSFNGNDGSGSGIAGFECDLDSAGFAPCTSPQNYTGLSDGNHTFQVRAVDNAGNVDPSPAAYTWTIDTTPPDTSITAQPADPSTSASAAFSFSGNDGSGSGIAGLQCDLDGTGFAPCTSPQTYTGLSDGSHTFQVRAVDGAGNVDASPAAYTWNIDTTPPDTSITAQPADPSNSAGAAFSFNGNDGSGSGIASFQCDLDGTGFAPCTSPRTYTDLSNGSHTFQVRAVDGVGNVDASPASYTWTIDTTPPDTSITANPPDPNDSFDAAFSFSGNDGSGAGVTGFECDLDGAGFIPCASPQNYYSLRNGSHTFRVRAVDGAGNVDASPAAYTWTTQSLYIYYFPLFYSQ